MLQPRALVPGNHLASPLAALALTTLAAGLYGLALPILDGGAYALLLPLAAVLAAIVILRPEIGLMLVFLAAPLETTYLDLDARVKPHHVLGLLTMTGWVLQFATSKKHTLIGSILNVPLFLTVLLALTSFIVHSQYAGLGVSLFALQLWFIAMVYLVASLAGPELLRRCFWAFVTAAVLEAGYGIIQAAGFYQEMGASARYGLILVEGRPFGTFTEPDFLAPFLVGGLLLAMPFWRAPVERGWRILLQATCLFLLAAVVLTMVRASWLGLAAGAVTFALLKAADARGGIRIASVLRHATGPAIALGAAAAALAFFAPTAFNAVEVRAKNIVSIVEPENPHPTRLREVTETWEVAREDLLTGHGIGTFGVTTAYGQKIAAGSEQTRAGVVGSGTALGLLHDEGIPGLAVFAFLIGLLLWRLCIALRAAAPSHVPYLQGALICVVGLTVSSLFNNLYYFGYYWLVIALAAALAQQRWQDHRDAAPLSLGSET